MNEEESVAMKYLEQEMEKLMKPFMEALAKKQTPAPLLPDNWQEYWT